MAPYRCTKMAVYFLLQLTMRIFGSDIIHFFLDSMKEKRILPRETI